MDKNQDDKPLPPGVEPGEVTQGKSGDTTKPGTSSTSTASNGTNGNGAGAAALPGPGMDDTVSLKPGAVPRDTSTTESSSVRPRPKSKNDTVNIPNAGRMLSMYSSRQATKPGDRATAYRHWLESRSKEDLIEILLGLDEDKDDIESTAKMAKVQASEPSNAPPASFQISEDLVYLRLPTSRRTPFQEATPTWRIVLVSLDQESKPIGLLIDGEITIGRTAGDTTPDLDLTPFDAKRKGVSRIHAWLRPSMHTLTLIDNDSSNGTFWNRLRIPPHTGQPLKDGDVCAFGRANFLVRIVKAPDTKEARTLI